MTLREKQARFAEMLCSLFAFTQFYDLRVFINELYRTLERQRELVAAGKSRALDSKHITGLAADIYILNSDNTVNWRAEDYAPMGEHWKFLGGRWGGDFPVLVDATHFEFKE